MKTRWIVVLAVVAIISQIAAWSWLYNRYVPHPPTTDDATVVVNKFIARVYKDMMRDLHKTPVPWDYNMEYHGAIDTITVINKDSSKYTWTVTGYWILYVNGAAYDSSVADCKVVWDGGNPHNPNNWTIL